MVTTICPNTEQLAALQAGKLNLETASMRLDEVVEKVCAMLEHVAVKGDVRMTVFVDPAIPRY